MTAFDLPSIRSRELEVVVVLEDELLFGAEFDEEEELEDEAPGLSSLARFGLSSEAVELEELEEEVLLDELEPPTEPDGLEELEDEAPGLSSLVRFGLSSEPVELEEDDEEDDDELLEPELSSSSSRSSSPPRRPLRSSSRSSSEPPLSEPLEATVAGPDSAADNVEGVNTTRGRQSKSANSATGLSLILKIGWRNMS